MKTSARAGTTLFSASPVVRFLLEATFLVAVGVGAAFLRLGALTIALVMGLAWIAVALVERGAAASKLARAAAAREPVPEPTPTLEDLLAEPSPPKLEEEPASPAPAAAPSQAEPAARFRWRGEARSRRAPVPPTPAQAPREWNLWELERRARELGGTNGMPEEWGALFRSLREFASPNGELPSEFDALVRESFPELIGAGS